MKIQLSQFVKSGMSTWDIARKLSIHQSKVRRLLAKYNLKTNAKPRSSEITKFCGCCFKVKTSDINKNLCNGCITGVRRLRIKFALIQYKGSFCEFCGLKANLENYGAFDFHHIGSDKLFTLAGQKHSHSWEALTREANKCQLLCCMCHRLQHQFDAKHTKTRVIYIRDAKHDKNEIQKLCRSFLNSNS